MSMRKQYTVIPIYTDRGSAIPNTPPAARTQAPPLSAFHSFNKSSATKQQTMMNASYHPPMTALFNAKFNFCSPLKIKRKFGTSFSPSVSLIPKRRLPIAISFPAACLVIQTTQAQPQTTAQSVIRRLVLLRHAESSWGNRSIRDHDRPLSNTGQKDAVIVSRKLQSLGWIPELIICSDARRTRETLKIMQEEVQGILEAEVHFLSSFYSVAAMDGQTAEHLQQAICEYSRDEILTVMCMGHNRGWEEAASMFCGVSVELKTCNAALLEADGKSWEEAFSLAGFGGWKLHGIVKPDDGR